VRRRGCEWRAANGASGRRLQAGNCWRSMASEHHNSSSDTARNTASVRVLTASFKKMRLTCDFTVSGEISRVRAMGRGWQRIPSAGARDRNSRDQGFARPLSNR
jgi:hypothetical protein